MYSSVAETKQINYILLEGGRGVREYFMYGCMVAPFV